jgi:hypothetical protein
MVVTTVRLPKQTASSLSLPSIEAFVSWAVFWKSDWHKKNAGQTPAFDVFVVSQQKLFDVCLSTFINSASILKYIQFSIFADKYG